MISRCPSCAGQVDDEADRCPSCHWDFNQRRRVPPDGAALPPEPAAPKQEGAPPKQSDAPPGLAGLKMVAFSEGLTETRPAKEPPVKKDEPAASGAGLLQFPKLDPDSRKKDNDEDPFALPTASKLKTFGKEPPPPVKPPPAEPPKLPSAKPGDALPRLRPEDKPADSPFEPAPAPAPRKQPNPDFLKDLPRERPAEERPEPKSAPAAKAPPPQPAAAPKSPEKIVFSASEPEPPKTIIRGAKPAREEPFKGDSKPPRKIERPAPKESPEGAPAADAPPKKAPSAMVWGGAALLLVALGAGGALLLSPRRGADLGSKAQPAAGAIFAQPAPAAVPPAAAPVAPAASSAAPPVVPPAPAAAPAPAPTPAAPVSVAPVPAAPPQPAPKPVGTAGDRSGVVVLLKAPPTLPANLAQQSAPQARAQWTFEGRVYDLIALNDVGGATLTLIGPDGKEAAETTTTPDGHYKFTVDALPSGGYTLQMSHPDYTGRFLDDIKPPFEEEPREARLLAAQGTGAKPFIGKAGRAVTRTLVAIPKNTDE